MCGIAGFVSPRGERADQEIIAGMVAALRHRGPDAVGYHVDRRVALGAARLRVIAIPARRSAHGLRGRLRPRGAEWRDLRLRGAACGARVAGSPLPVSFRHTEIVAHAWEDEGEHCVDRLNGMFALALWDARREQLFLARDRMGEKPLHYALAGGTLVFASELRALLAHPAVSARLDPEASRATWRSTTCPTRTRSCATSGSCPPVTC
jgi:asparagine synthase (glutamine-hydrolysing)